LEYLRDLGLPPCPARLDQHHQHADIRRVNPAYTTRLAQRVGLDLRELECALLTQTAHLQEIDMRGNLDLFDLTQLLDLPLFASEITVVADRNASGCAANSAGNTGIACVELALPVVARRIASPKVPCPTGAFCASKNVIQWSIRRLVSSMRANRVGDTNPNAFA
jgi:hypothetical protein